MRMRAHAIADSKNAGLAPRRRLIMDKTTYDKGMAVRRAVLGDEYVDAAVRSTDDFNRPLQDMLNEYCWGALWGREGLPRKTRSMLNLAMISVLNRPHELRAHIRGALRNGVTRAEISEIFLQVMVYAGAPAAVDSFRTAREVFAELDKKA
jgi:4-carboxymuconolactone decarboxylase